MRRGVRTAGWILLAVAVLFVAVIVPVGALRAHSADEFNRWVGLATVVAVPLAALAPILMFWDKIAASMTRLARSDNDTPEPVSPSRSGDTLPLRNQTFTGRTAVLEVLGERLTAGPLAVVALRGLGGVGKSQLALEYAHRMRQSGRYQLVGWVRADSPVTVAEDLAALAPLLGLPVEGTVGDIAAQAVAALRSRRDWLVVFDNAQGPGDLFGMLPGGGGHVLITSRNRAWSGMATQIDVSEFSRVEAVEFLLKRTGATEPEAAEELADELGDLPLALAQAAAYIDTRSITIGEYLERYRDPMLARRLLDAGLDSTEYPASVARTWLLSFTQLSADHPAAVDLLRLCAFFDPDDIDLDLLSAGSSETNETLARVLGDRMERVEATGALAATSLVTIPAKDHLRVHRLVQAVTRDQLDDDQAAEWAKRALNLVAAIFPPEAAADYRSWPIFAKLAPHIEAVTAYTSSYPMAAERITVLRKLGVYLSASGQLGAARSTFERLLAISEEAYGPEHPEVAMALGNLGETQSRLGELRAARANTERALTIFQKAYGPEHPEVAKAIGNLGLVQRDLGEVTDARASFERALTIDEAAYGPDHLEVGRDLYNLGLVQRDVRELRAARASFERALAIFQAAVDPDSDLIGLVLFFLGAVDMRLGKLRAGSASIERALAIFQAAYGPNRRDVMKALGDLGIVHQRNVIINYFISLAFKRQRQLSSLSWMCPYQARLPALCRGWLASDPGRLLPGPWLLAVGGAEAPLSRVTGGHFRKETQSALDRGGVPPHTKRVIPGPWPRLVSYTSQTAPSWTRCSRSNDSGLLLLEMGCAPGLIPPPA